MLKKKDGKKLTLAQKSCIKFGVLSAANAALGVTGLVLSGNTLLTLASVASLGVSVLWGALAFKSTRADKTQQSREKRAQKEMHKKNYKQACSKRRKQVKNLNKQYSKKTYKKNHPDKTSQQRKADKKQAFENVPKSAKPYKFCRGAAIAAGIISTLIAVGSGVGLANNYINASTLASEANGATNQYVKHEAAVNTGLGIGIATVSTAGLVIATVAATKAVKKREDEIIDAEIK